ncbi:MAG: cysteine--tRNA ligase [Candidatus Micrarchaeota archaeon]|nr:cysteine--tRNA ligase [Candidatus Micrarchaeota archaeon]
MVKLYDTLSGQLKEVYPHSSDTIFMYVCGITPYDDTHIGHARTFASIDILRRYLEYTNQKVYHIQNVTDIDDKIINRAKELKKKPLEISNYYDLKSRELLSKLDILQPHIMPKVSQSIEQILDLIEKILNNGFAYISKSGIYFDVLKYNGSYGELSKQDLEKIKAGARIEPKEDKKNPADFALWKFEKEEGATFPSKWGEGRPGWHIECSAMAMSCTKGKPLDLHAGARDLIFPHHENEIAQSHAAGYRPFCYHWLHTGFLVVNGEKMSKSLGNFITLQKALEDWSAPVLRLFFALSHYSSALDFSKEGIESSFKTYQNIKSSLFIVEQKFFTISPSAKEEEQFLEKIEQNKQKFLSLLENNLQTPEAAAVLIESAKEVSKAFESGKCSYFVLKRGAKTIKELFEILGVKLTPPTLALSKKEIEQLILKRQQARLNKNFEEADKIRQILASKKIVLEDSALGTIWKIKEF